MLISGIVLIAVALFLISLSFYLLTLFVPLLVGGIVLLFLGVVLPAPAAARIPPPAPHPVMLQAWLAEMYQRQAFLEARLRTIEERLSVPPAAAPPAPPTAAPPTLGAPPPVAYPPWAPLPAPTPPVAPSPPVTPTVPPEVSRFELELGEKWFQRIGIVVLALAFAFLLAIVLPRMSPEQIVALDFLSAIGLALLGEYVYRRQGLHDFAKGLEVGAFVVAYLGVWGAGFHFRLPGFPWALALAAVLGVHAAATLRYRSPFLAIEAGAVYLAWAVWLRAVAAIGPWEFALLLAIGGAAVLGLAYAQPREPGALVLAFGFGGAPVATVPLLGTYGAVPVVAIGLGAAAMIWLSGRERAQPAWEVAEPVVWGVVATLAFVGLMANAGAVGDLVALAALAALTAAFAAVGFRAGRGSLLARSALLGALTAPLPLLLVQGEYALLAYPLLLAAIAAFRPAAAHPWLASVVYLQLIAFAAFGRIGEPLVPLGIVWALFFGTAILHVHLQGRPGYGAFPTGFPKELQALLFAVALAGLTVWRAPDAAVIALYAAALLAALTLNRASLLGAPRDMALLVAVAGIAMAVASAVGLRPLLAGPPFMSPFLPGGVHVAVLLGLAAWIAWRRPVEEIRRGDVAYRISWPSLAILLGLLAQEPAVSAIFIAVPAAAVALAVHLDDAITFNVAYLALSGQIVFALAMALAVPADALPYLLPLLAGLLAVGLALDLASRRQRLARSSQLAGAATLFAAAPVALGPSVETTILWTAVGAVAVAWGLWRRFASLRYLGLLLVFGVLGKVFLYDIAGLALEVRIVGLVVVAATLLAISYGYARYRKAHAPS